MKTEPREMTLRFGAREICWQLCVMNRKKLRIVVRPDLSVRADAPDQFSEEEIIAAVQSKAGWIVRQLDSLADFHPLPTPHRYIGGETFHYLGRQYRLRVDEGKAEPAKLRGRFLHVLVQEKSDAKSVQAALDDWYRQRAADIFGRYLDRCLKVAKRHGAVEPVVAIRKMRTRWGSCSAAGRITLNLHLVQAPVHCIEYVVMHELCHLVEHNHSHAFYRLLTRCMPDWQKRKAVLRNVALAVCVEFE